MAQTVFFSKYHVIINCSFGYHNCGSDQFIKEAVSFRVKHLVLIRNDLVKIVDSFFGSFDLKFNQSIYLTWSVRLAKKLVYRYATKENKL